MWACTDVSWAVVNVTHVPAEFMYFVLYFGMRLLLISFWQCFCIWSASCSLLPLRARYHSLWSRPKSYQYLTSLGLPRDLARPKGSCRLAQSCEWPIRVVRVRVPVKSVTNHISDKSFRWQSTRWRQFGDSHRRTIFSDPTSCVCLHLTKFIVENNFQITF